MKLQASGTKMTAWLKAWHVLLVLVVVLAVFLGYGYRQYERVSAEKFTALAELEESRTENERLSAELRAEREIVASFQGQISSIGSVVGDLEKLSQTDEELLKKYSKVYFLNENYVPPKLTEIEEKHLYREEQSSTQVHGDVWPYLKRLLEDADRAGNKLLVASAYRSYDTQAVLKNGYTVIYGSGANQFSADQGYSEHQLGTTVDFTTSLAGANFAALVSEPAYQWLLDNAHRYGFILSYQEGNAYYKFEPWHWRYVGQKLATMIKNEGTSFYALDQREIDKYLITLFD